MIVDCHVHISAFVLPHGRMSERLQGSLPFRYMRWRLGLKGSDAGTERALERILLDRIEGSGLDAAVVLAFDAVHDGEGRRDDARTHLYVSNDYVIELVARNPRMLFGASIHPYREDAVAELERCAKAGAVLVKWLPIVQDFDPSDARCFAFYEAMAHLGVPLLSHTGGEQSLPQLNNGVADPMLLEPALKRGVTVIAAHCGTRSRFSERDFVPEFVRLARTHEKCYGDTSALSLPARWHAYRVVVEDKEVREKLVHGSDWPIPAFPPPRQVGLGKSLALMRDGEWMRRDVAIKRALGFDEAYWQRAAKVLSLPR